MDRLFLDANILFSAAYRPDSGLSVLWRLEDVDLVTSDYAVDEARRNLASGAQRERLTSLLEGVMVHRAVAFPKDVHSTIDLPAKDLPILAGALSAAATHLITGDLRHFGPYLPRSIQGLRVMTPAQYLKERGWPAP